MLFISLKRKVGTIAKMAAQYYIIMSCTEFCYCDRIFRLFCSFSSLFFYIFFTFKENTDALHSCKCL